MLTSLGLGLHYGVGVIIVALNIIMLIGIIRKQVLWKGATGWVLLQFELNLIFYLIFSNGLKFQILTGNFSNILTAPTMQTILGNSFQIINMAYPLGVAGIFIVYASAVKALRSYYGQLALMMAGFPVLISIVFNLLGLYPYNLQDNSKYNITLTVMIYVLAGMTFHLLYKNISSVKMFFLFVLLFVMVVMMGLYGVFLTIL
jgi:hypothetical protein